MVVRKVVKRCRNAGDHRLKASGTACAYIIRGVRRLPFIHSMVCHWFRISAHLVDISALVNCRRATVVTIDPAITEM